MLHLYYYYSDNCVSCEYLHTFFKGFSKVYEKYLVVHYLNIENHSYNIPGIPFVQFYMDGKDLRRYSLLGSNVGNIINNTNIILNQD
jgi:hypothetical protein